MLSKAENRNIPTFAADKEQQWEGMYYFIHAADPQFGFMDVVEGGNGGVWQKDIKLTEEMLQTVSKMRPAPRFIFFNGDLTHEMPDADSERKEKQIADFKSTLTNSDLNIPILVSSGNHDIGNSPDAESLQKYKDDFGDDYYSFNVGGVKYIVLNSQPWFEGEGTKLRDEFEAQKDWLEKEITESEASCNNGIVFMHIPLFVESAAEPDQYFNITTDIRNRLLRDFARAGVKTVFCGHYHRCAGGVWRDGTTEIEVAVSSAIGAQLGTDKPGFAVVKVEKDKVSQKYFALDEMPIDLGAIDFGNNK